MAHSSHTRSDAASHLVPSAVGIVIFLVGVALVGYVFSSANALLSGTPPPTVPTPAPSASPAAGEAANAASSAALDIGRSMADLVKRLLVLLVMCFAGSVVASLGIRLFFSSRNVAHATRDVPPGES
jgi:hypothetical protein